MGFQSLEEIVKQTEKVKKPMWEVILLEDLKERDTERVDSLSRMSALYLAMKSAETHYEPQQKSASHLVGGDGGKMEEALKKGESICGDFIGEVMVRALKMGECNACMKRIVAAPTAGSCGVMPAVLISYEEHFHAREQDMLEGMYIASGIGQVIAARASISGAEGGCQAEIGSASAMAAGAVAYLRTHDPECVTHAAAIALKSLLGLTCDPVAGLVEVPCVKRNVIGAVNALTSADMAVAGIRSAIPPDEVIDAMAEIGCLLPTSLRETSEAGLATTPTGIRIAKELAKD